MLYKRNLNKDLNPIHSMNSKHTLEWDWRRKTSQSTAMRNTTLRIETALFLQTIKAVVFDKEVLAVFPSQQKRTLIGEIFFEP